MTVNVDYTSRDFDGFKQSLLEYARTRFPEWVPGSEGDFGVLMLELLAYVGDVNSYYVDRAQREAYLGTASQAGSVLQIAQMLGYVPHTGAPAQGFVTLKNSAPEDRVVPAGTRFASDFIPELDGQILFENDALVVVPEEGTLNVNVTEGETKRDETTGGPLKVGDGTGLVDQSIRLPHPLVYSDTVRVWVQDEEWRATKHLLDGEPGERVFSVRTDASGFTWVDFGDGLNGQPPALGLSISAIYRTGYGARGNIPASRITSVYKADLLGVSIEATSNEMTEGADPESIDQIRGNAPRVFYTQQRAVNVQDFENFALGVPGVTKAHAVADFSSSVTIYVIGPDGNAPSASLVDRVTKELQGRALAGTTVTVGAPEFVDINIGSLSSPLVVEAWPTHTRSAVQYAVEQAVKTALAFTNADLGMKVTASVLYQTIMSVDGVRYVDIPLLARADSAQTGTADIQLQPWEFPRVANLTVSTTGGLG